jgi:chromosome segregation ATPase
MRETPYPMAAVRTQRDLLRREAVARLATARSDLQLAEATLAAATAALSELQRRRSAGTSAAATKRSEPHALGSELARHGAYAARLQGQVRELQAQLRAAAAVLAERQRALRLAELSVVEAHAQREVVERHHAQFRAAERKAAELAQEIEAEESRRHPAPRA